MDPVSVAVSESMNRKTRLPLSDDEAQGPLDGGSVLSGGSGRSKGGIKERKGITCKDIKLIMPTVLILLFTIFIMVTVIPYAFSSVIKQLQAVRALEAQAAELAAAAAERSRVISDEVSSQTQPSR